MTFKEKRSNHYQAKGEVSPKIKMFFKIKTGFGENDFISITEDELPMALRAQLSGKIALLNGGSVAGNNIISITPDWNRMLGFNPTYKLQPEDYKRIGDKKVKQVQEIFFNLKNLALGITPPSKAVSDASKELSKKLSINGN
jgi:hypothetical protein